MRCPLLPTGGQFDIVSSGPPRAERGASRRSVWTLSPASSARCWVSHDGKNPPFTSHGTQQPRCQKDGKNNEKKISAVSFWEGDVFGTNVNFSAKVVGSSFARGVSSTL